LAIRALVYSSQIAPNLSLDRVDDLARDAGRFNVQAGVTGVLLFDGVRFLQYIEGPEDGLNVVYARILSSTSHFEIKELAQGFIIGRRFPYWSMRLVPADGEDLDFVNTGSWAGFSRSDESSKFQTGVDRLATIIAPELGREAH